MDPTCSNQIAEMMLEGMQEVVGRGDLQAFFQNSSFREVRLKEPANHLSYKDLCEFQEAVEVSYGTTGGRGILCRSGRASFKLLLPAFWKVLGLTNLQYRLLPTPSRIKTGLKALAQVLAQIYGEEISTSDEGDAWMWTMRQCPYCYQRETHGPVCDYSVGILQEYLSWTSSGRFFMVEEIECVGAGGSACRIRIQKKPLD